MVTNIYPTEKRPHRGSFVKSQIDSLKREGIDIELIVINAWNSHWEYAKAAWKVFRSSFKSEFDLIHAHYGFSGFVSRLQWRLPVLLSFCGDDVLGTPNPQGKKYPISMAWVAINQLLSFVVSSVIVKSDEMKKKLFRKQNVYVIPNGVDFSQFRPMEKVRAKQSLGLKKSVRYILFPSNPSVPRKCLWIAEEAVQILKSRGFPVELLIVYGQPPEKIPLYMNAADMMVLASYWEGSPNVIKEAMACNCPIVSVDVGDVKNLIKECQGCVMAPRRATLMADEMENLFIDEKRSNGREYIVHLEIRRVALRIIALYRQIVAHRQVYI
jgi:teichuronic acid biosynthesis glycosyltransferase TuaC